MNFRIADTFTDSLARLTGDEQKAVKTTAFDLQLNPANPAQASARRPRGQTRISWGPCSPPSSKEINQRLISLGMRDEG